MSSVLYIPLEICYHQRNTAAIKTVWLQITKVFGGISSWKPPTSYVRKSLKTLGGGSLNIVESRSRGSWHDLLFILIFFRRLLKGFQHHRSASSLYKVILDECVLNIYKDEKFDFNFNVCSLLYTGKYVLKSCRTFDSFENLIPHNFCRLIKSYLFIKAPFNVESGRNGQSLIKYYYNRR